VRNRGFSFKDDDVGGMLEVVPTLNSGVGGSDGRSDNR